MGILVHASREVASAWACRALWLVLIYVYSKYLQPNDHLTPHIHGVITGHIHTEYEYCISKYNLLATMYSYITEYCWYSKYEGSTKEVGQYDIHMAYCPIFIYVYNKYVMKHCIYYTSTASTIPASTQATWGCMVSPSSINI